LKSLKKAIVKKVWFYVKTSLTLSKISMTEPDKTSQDN